jgi:hypothetical protein
MPTKEDFREAARAIGEAVATSRESQTQLDCIHEEMQRLIREGRELTESQLADAERARGQLFRARARLSAMKNISQAQAHVSYAWRYLTAAEQIGDEPDLLQPRCHLYGHATELALKAFLLKRGVTPPRRPDGHNLVGLLASAVQCGLNVTESQVKCVVPNLNDIYFEGATGERYVAHYPIAGRQVFGAPAREDLTDLAQSILDQALF